MMTMERWVRGTPEIWLFEDDAGVTRETKAKTLGGVGMGSGFLAWKENRSHASEVWSGNFYS